MFNPLLCLPFSLHLLLSSLGISLTSLSQSLALSPAVSSPLLLSSSTVQLVMTLSLSSIQFFSLPALLYALPSSPPFSPYPLYISVFLSQSQSRGLISLHSFSEGHVYFHRCSAIVCLPHLSVKLLNSRRQKVLMKLWKEEDQGNVNATVVGRCWALSLRVGGRRSTQGHASRVNSNADLLKFNFKGSSQKHLAQNISRGECPLALVQTLNTVNE